MTSLRTALLASLLTGIALDASAGTDQPDLDELPLVQQIEALSSVLMEAPVDLSEALQGRVEWLQSVEHPDPTDRLLARESLRVLAPLAERLEVGEVRAQLEDASFRVLDPDLHAALSAAVGSDPELDRRRVDALAEVTRTLLRDHGLEGRVEGRTKSLYSLHQKMVRKGLPADQVYDRTGLRVRVDTVEQCYQALDLIHSAFPEISGTFDDYIVDPKPSGYQSLHTAVVVDLPGAASSPVEFQIRTHAMHDRAERGDAAHWRYKAVAA